MTHDMSPPANGKRYDLFLVRALQLLAVCGLILGVLLYAGLAVRNDTAAAERHLSEAASAGALAAQAELDRIDVSVERTAPLILNALGADVSAQTVRETGAEISDILASSPVAAIAVQDAGGAMRAIFGKMPADVAGRLSPASASKFTGRELIGLGLVPVSEGRAAYYHPLQLEDGRRVTAVYVLRAGAFRAALNAGAAAGEGWRAALVNSEGEAVLSSAAGGQSFSSSDAGLAARLARLQPVHKDEGQPVTRRGTRSDGALLEARPVHGGALHLLYLGEQPSAMAVLLARKWEFLALFGASMLGLVLALSLIQNEWRREDRQSEDTFLVMGQARTSCDLLDAGVIDWSLADGRVTYSQGWADMFARSIRPPSEDAFEWISRIHPEDQDAARDAYQSILDGARTEIEHRIRIRLPTGRWIMVLERGRAVMGMDGLPARLVLVQTVEAPDGRALRETLDGLVQPEIYSRTG